jgi:hypothetical protein
MTLLILASLFVVCARRIDPLHEEIRQLRRSTLMPGARLTSEVPLERGDWSVESSWELETELEWTDYQLALERAMPAGYELRPSGDEHASAFVKELPADRLSVRVVVLSPGRPLHLRVTLVAAPW